ncbi:MAG: hypothetical protein WCU80_00220 [Paludibacteraceae bacterium]
MSLVVKNYEGALWYSVLENGRVVLTTIHYSEALAKLEREMKE